MLEDQDWLARLSMYLYMYGKALQKTLLTTKLYVKLLELMDKPVGLQLKALILHPLRRLMGQAAVVAHPAQQVKPSAAQARRSRAWVQAWTGELIEIRVVFGPFLPCFIIDKELGLCWVLF